MRVCLGGTFDPFHVGHEALLAAAAKDATELFIGITDGALAARPTRTVPTWQERAGRVESFLKESGYKGKLVTRALTDPYGPAVTGDYDAIAATPETVRGAAAINAQRAANGKSPLRLIHVPHVLAQDLLPISATRIAAGLMDARGKRLTPVVVAVGSANPVKVEAVRREVGAILASSKVQSHGHAVASGVPEQPRDDEVVRGARNRARLAREADPACDYAVGVEAGLMRLPGESAHVEVQACVVVDRDGWETQGFGPGFHYPAWVTERALRGEMVSAILGPVANDPRIGSTTGAIGYLSDGRLDRTALTQQAVLMAFVPRIKRDLYVGPPPA
ncbi:MAG: inosine/xanthosine triphosphatase [Candidatus Thermoplasmatota archaeon]